MQFAAVLINVDKVISMPFAEDTNELSNQLNGLAIQLSTNSFSKETAEDKIRAKYTEAVFQKIEQGLNILLAKDPYNVNVEYIYKAYLKGKKRMQEIVEPQCVRNYMGNHSSIIPDGYMPCNGRQWCVTWYDYNSCNYYIVHLDKCSDYASN